MSLLKLPLLWTSAVSWHFALWYPPHPDPEDKIAVTSLRERMWRHAGLPCNLFLKYTTWLVSAAESIVIIHSKSGHSLGLPSDALGALGLANASKLTTSFIVGTFLVTAGGVIRVLSFRALGPMFTFTQGIRQDHRLVTTGPYAVVRHPGYGGLLICLVGWCMVYGSPDGWVRSSGVLNSGVPWIRPVTGVWWVIIGASCMTLFRRATEEDRMLATRFGKEWQAWARRVRYKLVPFVY